MKQKIKKANSTLQLVKCTKCNIGLNFFMTPEWVVIACSSCNQAAGKIGIKFFIAEMEKSSKVDAGKREEF